MMQIFNFFGSILGYLLWFLYTIFRNYGVAIILFTVILKFVMFPMSIKQQKSMASQSKLADKQKELQKKYGTNKQKYNEELAKLYEKEGVNPGSGCLTSLLPFPIMLGIYYSVILPLSNTLHIASGSIELAKDYISRIPGMVSASAGSLYGELEIIRNFDALKGNLTMFNPGDMEKMEFFSKGFKFLGLDLLATPQQSDFMSFLWLIPVLSLVTSFGYQFYMTKTSMTGTQGQPGCMKVMMYVFPLISVYWAYTMPAAVGFYWVISSVTSFVQSIVTNKYFSYHQMTAMSEAQRAVTLELAEGSVRPLPAPAQKEIADKIAAAAQARLPKESKQKQGQKKSGKKSGGSSNSTTDYLGNKK